MTSSSDCEVSGYLLGSATLVLHKESWIFLSSCPEGSALYHSQIPHIKQSKQYMQLQVNNQHQQIALPCHAHCKYLIFLCGYLADYPFCSVMTQPKLLNTIFLS